MSLLDKIQAKSGRITPSEEQEQVEEAVPAAVSKPAKKDILSTFRDLRRTEQQPVKNRVVKVNKHQELKALLHKQILSEMKDYS
jgi:pilus assembly protein CpaF